MANSTDYIKGIIGGKSLIPTKVLKEAVRNAQKNIDKLIMQLIELYPQVSPMFEKISYKSGQEIYVPFHISKTPPTFPIAVDLNSKGVVFQRDDSLVEQMKKQSDKLHDGNKYRLEHVSQDGNTKVGIGSYFKTLDGSDYYRERILAYWEICGETLIQKQFLKRSSVVREWVSHCENIIEGNFESYHAVMAFSMPWVIHNGKKMSLMATKGSSQKSAGAGERHVCPAGMFEPSVAENNRTEISFADMRYYLAKEAIEEMHNNIAMEESRYSFETLVEQVDKFHKENRSEILDAIFNSKPGYSINYLGMSVDAFRLRPELVFIIQSSNTFHAEVNWEYDLNATGPIKFNSRRDFEMCILQKRKYWVSPGLASAYMASKYLFQ